jgi:hypothetical protein
MMRAFTIATTVAALLFAAGCERGETTEEATASEAALNAPPSATDVHLDASVLADQEDLAEQAREQGTAIRESSGGSSARPPVGIEPVPGPGAAGRSAAPEPAGSPGEEQPPERQPAEGSGWSIKDVFVPGGADDE